MSSKAEKEKLKMIQDKCQSLLIKMLTDEDNKYCVDCDGKGPRWASWNLGIFLCIRCAGIHRNLGVHISRVKSVNLDSWTPEQVVSLQQMGNSRARAVYEANMPDNFRRPQSDLTLEAFIRAKYEQKKYIAKEWVAPPIPKVNWDKEFELKRKDKKGKEAELETSSKSRQTLMPSVPIPAPLPKPISSSPKAPRHKCTSAVTAIKTSNLNLSADLLGLDMPSNEMVGAQQSAEDTDNLIQDFGAFLSVSTASPLTTTTLTSATDTSRTAEEDNFFNQPVSNPTKQNQLTTDKILALYSQNQNVSQGLYQPNPCIAQYPPHQPGYNHQAPFMNRPIMPGQMQPGNIVYRKDFLPPSINNQYVGNPFYNIGGAPRPQRDTNRSHGQVVYQSTPPSAVPSDINTLQLQMSNLNLGSAGPPAQQVVQPNPPTMTGTEGLFPDGGLFDEDSNDCQFSFDSTPKTSK